MKFTGEFIREVKKKKPHLAAMLSEDYKSDYERKLKEGVKGKWLKLPEPETVKDREFAVDGSMAYRSLANGYDLFFARSLLIGNNDFEEKKKFRFEVLRSVEDPDEAGRFLRLLMEYLEVKVVLDNIHDLSDSIVFMDGSLYGRFTHYYREILVHGFEGLPLELISSMERLFRGCAKNDILLIGISKHSRSRALSHAIFREMFGKDVDRSSRAFIPSDVEMIYRWLKDMPGFSMPLVLGDYAVYWEIDSLMSDARPFLDKHFPDLDAEKKRWGKEVLEAIPNSPAIAITYLLPEKGELPMRIDVPCNQLGIESRIRDVSPAGFDLPEKMEPIISTVLASRGGRDVYNALLYVVDREVRMRKATVDTVYKSILGDELGGVIEYDRGTRRFY
jgi:hypothetical protein